MTTSCEADLMFDDEPLDTHFSEQATEQNLGQRRRWTKGQFDDDLSGDDSDELLDD